MDSPPAMSTNAFHMRSLVLAGKNRRSRPVIPPTPNQVSAPLASHKGLKIRIDQRLRL